MHNNCVNNDDAVSMDIGVSDEVGTAVVVNMSVHWCSDMAVGDVITSDIESAGISLTGVDVAGGVTGGVIYSEQTETSDESIFFF